MVENSGLAQRKLAPIAACGPRTGASGVSTFEVPLEVIIPIQEVFGRLDLNGPSSWLSSFMCCENDYLNDLSAPPYTFSVTEASTTASMKWLWPKDRKTFNLFTPLFEAVLRSGLCPGPMAAAPLHLWSVAIIIRLGSRLEESATEFHTDYWADGVLPGFAFSLLTPLHEFAPGTGGLECLPWSTPYTPQTEAEEPFRIPYRLGQVVAVDGMCTHRTEPYDIGGPESTLRAIISLDVHPEAPESAAAACRRSVRSQKHSNTYIRPNPWDEDASSEEEFSNGPSEDEED